MRHWVLAACLVLAPAWVFADTWPAPEVVTTVSANGQFRVTVEPAWGDRPSPPMAQLERLQPSGHWQGVWRQPLVNRTAPVDTLVTDDGKFVVTLDNWGSMGLGDDVVVVYGERGERLYQLSTDRILPSLYLRHQPRSVSTRFWRTGQPRLGPGQTLSLEINAPRSAQWRSDRTATLNLDLATGQSSWPGQADWLRMLATAAMLELHRLEDWKALRHQRSQPLGPPDVPDTDAWRAYANELLARVRRPGERIGAEVLPAAGQGPGPDDGHEMWMALARADTSRSYSARGFLLASFEQDRLVDVVANALAAKAPGSMSGARIVFVGEADPDGQLARAAAHAGAELEFIDPRQPYPPGEPLPEVPDPYWMPRFDWRPVK